MIADSERRAVAKLLRDLAGWAETIRVACGAVGR